MPSLSIRHQQLRQLLLWRVLLLLLLLNLMWMALFLLVNHEHWLAITCRRKDHLRTRTYSVLPWALRGMAANLELSEIDATDATHTTQYMSRATVTSTSKNQPESSTSAAGQSMPSTSQLCQELRSLTNLSRVPERLPYYNPTVIRPPPTMRPPPVISSTSRSRSTVVPPPLSQGTLEAS